MSLHSLPVADVLDPIVCFPGALRAMNTLSLGEGRNQIGEVGCGSKNELQPREVAVLDPLENLQGITSADPKGICSSGTFIQGHTEREQIGSGVNLLLDVPALLQWSVPPGHVTKDIRRGG